MQNETLKVVLSVVPPALAVIAAVVSGRRRKNGSVGFGGSNRTRIALVVVAGLFLLAGFALDQGHATLNVNGPTTTLLKFFPFALLALLLVFILRSRNNEGVTTRTSITNVRGRPRR